MAHHLKGEPFILPKETLITTKVSVVLRRMTTALTDQSHRIRQEAHTLFMRYGFKSVSMDDIASAIGMSKKTIYQFFPDKETLVAEVVKMIIIQNEQNCEHDRSIAKDAIHEVLLAINQMSILFQHMNPSLIFDLHKYYHQGYLTFQSHRNNYIQKIIRENLQLGIAEGNYREEIDIATLTRLRMETILIPFQPEFQQSVKAPLVDAAKELSIHYLFGVVSPKGYKLLTKYIPKNN